MTVGATEAPWYVCHTRPRCEKKFAALMEAESFEHYLPLFTSTRRYPSGAKRFSKPLFPGYVFAKVPADLKARIYQQELVARAIPVEDVTRFLAQLEDVRKIVAAGIELTVIPLLGRGRRVRLIGGPLHGLEGLVDDPSDPERVVISVDVLRQGLLLRVPADQLQVLP